MLQRVPLAFLVAAAALLAGRVALASTHSDMLTAEQGEPINLFGVSVAHDGTRAVLGGIQAELPPEPPRPGKAWVFDEVGGSFTESAELTASDGAGNDWFGVSVALDGDRIVVGSGGQVNLGDPGAYTGAAYVFEKAGADWVEVQKLTSSDAEAGDLFGYSVAVEGNTIVVGAFLEDTKGDNAGAAYVFHRAGGTWIETQKLLAVDGALTSHFGETIALEGNRLVIGAHISPVGPIRPGAVYVFERSSPTLPFVQTAKLVASDGEDNERFGQWVDVEGDWIATGARLDQDLGEFSGSAYVFEKVGASWIERQKILASDGETGDLFGHVLSMSGTRLAIGAPVNHDTNQGPGAVYLFERVGSTYQEVGQLAHADSKPRDGFGTSLFLVGDELLVGSPFDDEGFTDAGSAFVYHVDDDADGDTYPVATDCDDTRAAVNPGMVEIPGNFLDDDCDPTTAPGCQATIGAGLSEPAAPGDGAVTGGGLLTALGVLGTALRLGRSRSART